MTMFLKGTGREPKEAGGLTHEAARSTPGSSHGIIEENRRPVNLIAESPAHDSADGLPRRRRATPRKHDRPLPHGNRSDKRGTPGRRETTSSSREVVGVRGDRVRSRRPFATLRKIGPSRK